MTNCPKCGGALHPVALGPESAPWLCPRCMRGFWGAEVAPEARSAYRPRHDDWGLSRGQTALASAVESEVAAARTRGTSLRADQFAVTPLATLSSVALRGGLSPEFTDELRAFIVNSGDQS